MKLEATLTKENFWNEMMAQYPKATKHFFDWIDEYKAVIDWYNLFAEGVKFHDVPYAIQYGIWIEYCRQSLSDFFEQPEHISDTVDLAEDVKEVFEEMNELID